MASLHILESQQLHIVTADYRIDIWQKEMYTYGIRNYVWMDSEIQKNCHCMRLLDKIRLVNLDVL